MKDVIWATPLYEFLRQCNASSLSKTVLDCGAGGSEPPLSLFYQYGYQTFGIEIAEKPIEDAQRFSAENNMPLGIIRGDMRSIPFPSAEFSFIYSFNAIDFMTKPDIAIAMSEITRVLKRNGLCYVNFISVDDAETWEPFCKTSPALELLKSEAFAHFEDDEADIYFEPYVIVRKEKRIQDKLWEGKLRRRAEIEYIARKM
ncbi:MAG: SAM-dependent methyltransferase [Anaerolineales bacterium]|nr:class I SAM-dependent methyltransferase [Anaerolineae bacterium]PWB55787.1 MAG: SAM-dependent methyltransferase [Anaerolineales bacterium]